MQVKFNGGKGAVICDKCRVIILEGPFSKSEWDILTQMVNDKEKWFCDECDKEKCIQQTRKFIEKSIEIRNGGMAEWSKASDSKSEGV